MKSTAIYLLPNTLTTMGLFSGFLAILASLDGHFISAVYCIIVAMLLDALDGRVARMTGTESEFGKEFDSLADMVSFGVSPALVMYSWCYNSFGEIGYAVSFLYVAAVALRLAKFNTQVQEKNSFKGLPSPAGAATLICLVWFAEVYSLNSFYFSVIALSIGVLVAILMVSNIPYYSFKAVDLTQRISWVNCFLIVIFFFLFVIAPALVFFLMFMTYLISGLLSYFVPQQNFFQKLKPYLKHKSGS
ncbi:MAG: CDP-diacylglycerol--serine O-phosphatidyltransferase [Pseudomonadota bacterium]|nr:CDP-diacylglycerol--serine O-phosphatidyltransferase [Pseudomonadota bacterium]